MGNAIGADMTFAKHCLERLQYADMATPEPILRDMKELARRLEKACEALRYIDDENLDLAYELEAMPEVRG